MGTRWSAKLADGDAGTAEAAITAALDTVIAQMSGWEPASDLSRFNRSVPGRWQSLLPEMAAVVASGLAIAEASEGAFDPAAGALVDLWGFGPRPIDGLPEEAEVAAASRGWRHLSFDPAARRLRRDAPVMLDLSGIAKGFAVDHAAEALLAIGFRHFLLEVGGELRGEGVRPDGQPWWVDLERPPGASELALTRVALHGLSVATSGDYRRFLTAGERHLSHTIDPRSGRPVENGIASVTVLARSCMEADGWATALTVLGPAAAVKATADHKIAAQLIMRTGDGWREELSPRFKEMLET
ncbi:FAD:protein FMN transferase [Sphingomonas sp. ID0503]|uniref:FAD:protein FMN transferase n=1 Tax=Sphingomonas sp. ID0503 TaxID=3399691 RepID=UPI003AFA3783